MGTGDKVSGTGRAPARRAFSRWVAANRELWPLYAVFLGLTMLYWHLNPRLFTPYSLSNLSMQFLPLILASMGQTVVMLTGGIDLSVGAQVSLATVILARTMGAGGASVWGSILLVLVAGATVGAVNGTLVAVGRLPAIIVTLATSYIISGTALFILPEPGGYVAEGAVNAYMGFLARVPLPIWILAAAVAVWKFIKERPLGLALYAAGNNPYGAFVSGVNVTRVRVAAYALAGAFTAVGGIGLALQTSSGDPTVGTPYTLMSIAAAVLGGVSFLGGKGMVRGAVVGGLLFGFLLNMLFLSGISPFYQYVFQGLILVAAVALNALSPRSVVGT